MIQVRELFRAGSKMARLSGAAAVAAALGAGTSACTVGCRGAMLSGQPETVNRPGDLLALSARLTSDGKPLPGFLLNFYSTVTGGAENGSGDGIGSATTDANGVARISRPDTLSEALLPGERLTGYLVRFDAEFGNARGNYCSTKVSVPVTSHWTAPP